MKQSGSYATLLQGVSQQPPEVRQPGQHTEQVNMVPDPIKGLTRRPGTVLKAVQSLTVPVGQTPDSMLAWAGNYRVHEHQSAGVDYVVFIKERPGHGPAFLAYDRTNHAWIPVANTAGTEAAATAVNQSGTSAITSVGDYIVHAWRGVSMNAPSVTFSQPTKFVVWVRGGAYTRTYRVDCNNGAFFQYTTPNAGAAGAAEAISPQNIAAQLVIAAAGIGLTLVQSGAHISINSLSLAFTDISVSDGGDGSLIRGVMSRVDSVDDLTLMALDGHTVKVDLGSLETSYYVRASTKSPGLSEAIWLEAAGVAQSWPGFPIMHIGLGTASPTVKMLYAGISSVALDSQVFAAVPVPPTSRAGDQASNPSPRFIVDTSVAPISTPISYLGTFQDRLLVGAGAYLAVSGAGDYFNFFRSTIVTVPAGDPFEMVAQGSEDDVLRHSVVYNRNLVIFGNRRQYVISGTAQLSPLSPNMSVMTSYANAAQVEPVAAGGLIYYARDRGDNVEVHQIQPGAFVDSAESFPASAQIGDYIPAPVQQIEVDAGAPSELLVRTRDSSSVFTFSYLDAQDGRKQGAWYRWDFNPVLGKLMGVTPTPDGVLLTWMRKGTTAGSVYAVTDLLPKAEPGATLPHFDSARPYSAVLAHTHELTETASEWDGAYSSDSDRYLVGGDLVTEVPELIAQYPTETDSLYVGATAEAYVTPTNPKPRDGNERLILDAEMTVTRKSILIKDSAGFTATLTTINGDTTYVFNGRVLGSPSNLIGVVPLVTAANKVAIGRSHKSYTLKLAANKWYPFTLIGMDWTGQVFNRAQRNN